MVIEGVVQVQVSVYPFKEPLQGIREFFIAGIKRHENTVSKELVGLVLVVREIRSEMRFIFIRVTYKKKGNLFSPPTTERL